MNNGIAIAGNLIVDQIKYVDRYPSPSTLATISSTTRAMGGLLCNCIVDLARLDSSIPLQAIGVLGDDDMGEYIMQALAGYSSIDCSGIRRAGETSFTDVMTAPDSSRTFFQYRGANTLLCPDDFDFSRLQADILHIGYLLLLDCLDGPDSDYPTAMCRVLHSAKQAGLLTSIDVVSEDSDRFAQVVPPALAYTDYCTINEIEAERITGVLLRAESDVLLEQNLPLACRRLKEMGVSRWAIIHTPAFSCGVDEAGNYVKRASWKIPDGFKRSSVGAGDAFASGILYGVYNGWSMEKALHVAGAIAACSLSGDGGSDAIRPMQELMEYMTSLSLD